MSGIQIKDGFTVSASLLDGVRSLYYKHDDGDEVYIPLRLVENFAAETLKDEDKVRIDRIMHDHFITRATLLDGKRLLDEGQIAFPS